MYIYICIYAYVYSLYASLNTLNMLIHNFLISEVSEEKTLSYQFHCVVVLIVNLTDWRTV